MGAVEITALRNEVAAELHDGDGQRTVIVAGGALMAMRGLRDATRDVDSAELSSDRAAPDCGHLSGNRPRASRE